MSAPTQLATTLAAVPAERTRRSAYRLPPTVAVAGFVLLLLLIAVVAPGLLTPSAPDAGDQLQSYTPPSAANWLGTDQLGRDVYTRIVYGAAASLSIGVVATVIGALGGIVVGLLAAVGGRVVDEVLMRLVDVLLALPGLLLALVVITVTGPGNLNTALAIGIAEIAVYARLVRGKALTVRNSGYVDAATVVGKSRGRVIVEHILPNSLGPLLALAVVGVGRALIEGASLSFLGLGAQPPAPEWGSMLAEGRDALAVAWWIAVVPGAAVTVSVIAITVVGRYLQARFDRSE